MELGFSISLSSRVASTTTNGVDLIPPDGFVFLIEIVDGITYYIVDDDGYYILEPL